MAKKRKKRRRHAQDWGAFLLLAVLIVLIAVAASGIIWILSSDGDEISSPLQPTSSDIVERPLPKTFAHDTEQALAVNASYPVPKAFIEPNLCVVQYPDRSGEIMQLTDELDSNHAILIDLDNNTVIAEKGGLERIYPASMTKLMTLIVAIEHIEDFDATFTMTNEIVAPLYEQDASMAGFQPDEECTMMDLLYGTALPSGADATTALALHTAGSMEQFVQWMNEKVEELHLEDTHFVNATGLHDPNHYSTVTDIALILEYCMQNELCKEIISTYTHTTRVTPQSPEGIKLFSTMFSRMYGTEVEGITILGGKTGFTDEAGNCLASYAQTPDGHTYIAVTGGGITKWRPVYDAFKLYGIITGTYSMDEVDAHMEEETNIETE